MSEELRLTMDDLRRAGHCASGIRAFFLRHELDLITFVEHGLPFSAFDHIDDAYLTAVLAAARARQETGNG